MKNITKNIRHLRRLKNKTQEQFADELGVSRSRIGSYEEGRSEPPISFLEELSNYFNLPIDVIIKNDLTKATNVSFMEIGNKRLLFPIVVDSDNQNFIEVVPINTSAGYLDGYDDPEYIEQLAKMKLPFIPTGKHRAFPIKGDSMLPLKDGSFVVASFVEDINDIKDGKSYIIITQNDGMTYKRVYDHGEALHLKPDNKDYEDYLISKSDILELWEFTCSINTQEYDVTELKISGIAQMLNELGVELKELAKKVS
ncbi:helix-turn-helix domain-containing protein [Winogradskyella sp. 3972H.M.0a.05]|uniref:XRE family transcriptional regulator n=1 Tax=Winogradskyella sp. 3972H.M.0a.05 TaxID=2950277 RepID=UPI003390CA4B